MEFRVLRHRLKNFVSRISGRFPELDLKYPLGLSIILLTAFFWGKFIVGFLMVSITAVVSFVVSRWKINRLGIETATLFTVVSGYIFGPETGALLGFLVILAQLFTGTPGTYIIWVVPTYALAGYLSGVFSGKEINLLGPAISVGAQTVFMLFTLVVSRQSLGKYIQYAVLNVLFNFAVFSFLAPSLVAALTAGPIY